MCIRDRRKKISLYSEDVLHNFTKIAFGDISIKATTNEKLGFIGKEEGVAIGAMLMNGI